MKLLRSIAASLLLALALPSFGANTVTVNAAANPPFAGGPISPSLVSAASDGTGAAPVFSWVSDPDTGIYRDSANVFCFATNGTGKWCINSSGALVAVTNGGVDIGNGSSDPRDINLTRSVVIKGSTSGTLTIKPAAIAGTSTLTLPGGTTDFSATGGTSQFVKQASAGAALTVARPACADLSDASTGCTTTVGTMATQAASAVAITGGTITGTTIGGNTITTGTGTLTLAASKTLTVNKTLTLDGTDGTIMTFPATSASVARTDAAQTFTGAQTFSSTIVGSVNGNSATVTTNANLTGPITSSGNATAVAAQTGTGSTFVMQASPTITGTLTTSAQQPAADYTSDFGASATRWKDMYGGTLTLGKASVVNGTVSSVNDLYLQANASASNKIYGIINSVTTTTTNSTGFGVTGTITASAIASSGAAQSGYLCYNTTGGVITYDGGATCLVSREEYKDELGPIDNALQLVLSLRPFWGAYKADSPMKDHRTQPFLGARETARVDDRLTSVDAKGEPLGVRYENMSAVLIAAIKEQQAQIDALKVRVEMQQAMLDALPQYRARPVVLDQHNVAN